MDNLYFMHPHWLWLVLLIPLLWGARWLRHTRKGTWEQLVDKQLMPFVLSGKDSALGVGVLVLVSLGLLVATLAMAGPAWEKREVPVFRNQQALVIAMDFSASMYAADEKPNRLTLARFKLLDILKSRHDGQTGLVVFAGDAFMVSPLTDDIATIEEQAKNLSPEIMPAPGSLLAPAIQRAMALLQQAEMPKGHILLITDGASDPDNASVAAEQAQAAGYQVSVLTVGSEDGAPIVQPKGGFLVDSLGKTVVATVNVDALKAIAQAGGGVFTQAALGDADVTLLGAQWQAETNQKLTEGQGRQLDTWVNEGYWLVLGLLPLAALAFRRGWLGAVLVACVVLPQPQTAQAFSWQDLWKTPDQQAQEILQQGQPAEAAKLFRDPDWQAAAAYKHQDYTTAAKRYSQRQDVDGQYNYANTLAMQNKLPEAVKSYEQVLQQQPDHADAQHNLKLVKERLEQQQKQQQDQKGEGEQQQQASSDQQQQQQKDGESQTPQPGETEKQQQAAKEAEQKAQEDAQKAEQAEQQQAQAKQSEEKDKPAEDKPTQESESDPQQREQQQATEQWLRRIPDDPAGLWRRKFQYQYQQRGAQARGEEW